MDQHLSYEEISALSAKGRFGRLSYTLPAYQNYIHKTQHAQIQK